MNIPKRNRARVLTPEGLKKLQEKVRSHEADHNAGYKYTLERLGELTGLDPETVKNVLECKGSDKRTIARCFESFGLTLEEGDHISAAQVIPASADPNFVGREGAIADLNALANRNAKVIVIQARGGVGKTTLARKYLQQTFGPFLEFPIAKETKDIASIEGLLEEKLRQLGEEPGREFLVSLDRLRIEAELVAVQTRINLILDKPSLTEDDRDYLKILGILVYDYEQHHEPMPKLKGIELLKALMQESNFQSNDLVPIFGSETAILEALNHEKQLTEPQIQTLASFFHISPTSLAD
jgi:antitoxin component HigA of HigAB toxin-antitoxin module